MGQNYTIKDSLGFQEFMKDLRVRVHNKRKYYYLNFKNSIMKKKFYIGPYSEDVDDIVQLYTKFLHLLYQKMNNKVNNKTYWTLRIHPQQALFLDYLRVDYFFLLNSLPSKELNEYLDQELAHFIQGSLELEGEEFSIEEISSILSSTGPMPEDKDEKYRVLYNYRDYINYWKQTKPNPLQVNADYLLMIYKTLMKGIKDRYIHYYEICRSTYKEDKYLYEYYKLEDIDRISETFYRANQYVHPPIELIGRYHELMKIIYPFRLKTLFVLREFMRQQLIYYHLPTIILRKEHQEEYQFHLSEDVILSRRKIHKFFIKLLTQRFKAFRHYFKKRDIPFLLPEDLKKHIIRRFEANTINLYNITVKPLKEKPTYVELEY